MVSKRQTIPNQVIPRDEQIHILWCLAKSDRRTYMYLGDCFVMKAESIFIKLLRVETSLTDTQLFSNIRDCHRQHPFFDWSYLAWMAPAFDYFLLLVQSSWHCMWRHISGPWNNATFIATHSNAASRTMAAYVWHIEAWTKWPTFSNAFSWMKIYAFRLRFH